MKLYQNGDRCPCCGTVLAGKSGKWLAEFSQLVADLGLPEWPGLPESWDAERMNEEAPKKTRTAGGADLAGDREGRSYGRTAEP